MNINPNQPDQPQSYTQWGQQQQPQYGQQQWGQQPQHGQQQWGAPSNYAQPQPDASNFLMRWLMMGIAVRIAVFVLIPLLLCGGCALFATFAAMHP